MFTVYRGEKVIAICATQWQAKAKCKKGDEIVNTEIDKGPKVHTRVVDKWGRVMLPSQYRR